MEQGRTAALDMFAGKQTMGERAESYKVGERAQSHAHKVASAFLSCRIDQSRALPHCALHMHCLVAVLTVRPFRRVGG